MPSHLSMEDVYRHACEVIPGGVSSPVRAFGSVGGTPVFLKAASGAHVVVAFGSEFVAALTVDSPALAPVVSGRLRRDLAGD